jgi:hypothetical protein
LNLPVLGVKAFLIDAVTKLIKVTIAALVAAGKPLQLITTAAQDFIAFGTALTKDATIPSPLVIQNTAAQT